MGMGTQYATMICGKKGIGLIGSVFEVMIHLGVFARVI